MKHNLEERWNRWKDCLCGDDRNSIFSQIIMLLWETTIFQIVLEGRQLREKDNPEDPQVSGYLHAFIDRNFFQAQSAAIRRIVEKKGVFTGKDGVYSLGALINDIKNHRKELTREVFLVLRGLQYDSEEVRKKKKEFILEQPPYQMSALPEDLDSQRILNAHEVFDHLSGVKSFERTPNDKIEEKVFRVLTERLNECDSLSEFVNKFIAHSATPESRSSLPDSQITGSALWEAEQMLYEIANFLGGTLFSIETMPMPDVPYDVFKNWNKPLFLDNEKSQIHAIYNKRNNELEDLRVNSVGNIWEIIDES